MFPPTVAGGLSTFGPIGGAGEFNIDLGWAQGGPGSNGCRIQINGRTPGTYLGVITATVAVLVTPRPGGPTSG